ncbi:MAG: hypothetical protein ACKO3S_09350 [bacterium]
MLHPAIPAAARGPAPWSPQRRARPRGHAHARRAHDSGGWRALERIGARLDHRGVMSVGGSVADRMLFRIDRPTA